RCPLQLEWRSGTYACRWRRGSGSSRRAPPRRRPSRGCCDSGDAARGGRERERARRLRRERDLSAQSARRAAARASGRGASDVSVTYLRRAFAEPAPEELKPVLTHELGAAALRAGDLALAM